MLGAKRNEIASIRTHPQVFTLINTFAVGPERQEVIIPLLRDVTETVTRAMPGFVAASVHKGLDRRHIVNYVQWRTRADFEAMLADPRMQRHMREVRQLALAVMPILCSVVYVGEIAMG